MKISVVTPTFEKSLIIKIIFRNYYYFKNKKYPKYDQYEYLVIDNCSDDKTVDEVLKLREKDQNIKLLLMIKIMVQFFLLLQV